MVQTCANNHLFVLQAGQLAWKNSMISYNSRHCHTTIHLSQAHQAIPIVIHRAPNLVHLTRVLGDAVWRCIPPNGLTCKPGYWFAKDSHITLYKLAFHVHLFIYSLHVCLNLEVCEHYPVRSAPAPSASLASFSQQLQIDSWQPMSSFACSCHVAALRPVSWPLEDPLPYCTIYARLNSPHPSIGSFLDTNGRRYWETSCLYLIMINCSCHICQYCTILRRILFPVICSATQSLQLRLDGVAMMYSTLEDYKLTSRPNVNLEHLRTIRATNGPCDDEGDDAQEVQTLWLVGCTHCRLQGIAPACSCNFFQKFCR